MSKILSFGQILRQPHVSFLEKAITQWAAASSKKEKKVKDSQQKHTVSAKLIQSN